MISSINSVLPLYYERRVGTFITVSFLVLQFFLNYTFIFLFYFFVHINYIFLNSMFLRKRASNMLTSWTIDIMSIISCLHKKVFFQYFPHQIAIIEKCWSTITKERKSYRRIIDNLFLFIISLFNIFPIKFW